MSGSTARGEEDSSNSNGLQTSGSGIDSPKVPTPNTSGSSQPPGRARRSTNLGTASDVLKVHSQHSGDSDSDYREQGWSQQQLPSRRGPRRSSLPEMSHSISDNEKQQQQPHDRRTTDARSSIAVSARQNVPFYRDDSGNGTGPRNMGNALSMPVLPEEPSRHSVGSSVHVFTSATMRPSMISNTSHVVFASGSGTGHGGSYDSAAEHALNGDVTMSIV